MNTLSINQSAESEEHHYNCECGIAPTTGYHMGKCNPHRLNTVSMNDGDVDR